MSTNLTAYSTLVGSAQPSPSPLTAPEILPAACALLSHAALAAGPLPLQGPWRLHSATCHQLTRSHGATPPGGWQGLAAAMAGMDAVEVRQDGFHALLTPEALAMRGEEDLYARLVEALTLKLVPPTTAAGIFLLMGLHPGWGLRLANRAHQRDGSGEREEAIYDPRLFPVAVLDAVERGIFGATLSVVCETLRSLDAGMLYSLDALAQLIYGACQFGRGVIAQRAPDAERGGLDLFIDHLTRGMTGSQQRALDFTMVDLMDQFLVPIGAAQRFDDLTFCVWPERVPGKTRVFGQRNLDDARWLCRFLTGDADSLVA